ncbi:MAG: hypothetical protein QXN36_01275 [Candidatus Bathyarchaeia archaeon]
MSVADILKEHGKWIESSKFLKKVREKLNISERQAYRLIKKDKLILKLTLQDRRVLYGLAEFGLPTSEAEKPSEIELIKEDAVKGNDVEAWNRLVLYADTHNLNPHPTALYNENIAKLKKENSIYLLTGVPDEIEFKIRRNIIRYWLRKLE